MDPLSASAASGLRSRMEALDLLANNIANAATAGYKVDREAYNLYFSEEALNGDGVHTQPVIEGKWTDFSQGTITPTGNPLDLAISGRGFFAVNGPNGTLYTRNGSFHVAPDGTLASGEGHQVRGANNAVIRVERGIPIEIDPGGEVRQAGEVVGRLELVDFGNLHALEKYGKNYWTAPNASAAPRAAAGATIQQGGLESSNVSAPESAVRIIGVMRQFEMLQKALTLAGDMNRKALEEVAKVNG